MTNIILIGYGNMGKEWGKIIRTMANVRVVGIVEFIEKNRQEARTDFSLSENSVSNDFPKLLSYLKPHAVIDCSPPFAHYNNTILALNNNCHVLGEKPISLNMEEAKRLVDLSIEKKRTYMVNQNYRRNPMISIIMRNLHKIGKLYAVYVDYFQGLEFNDTFRYSFDHPLLLDMSIHHFDLVRMITNSNASSVNASEYNPKTSKFKNGSGVLVNCIMENNILFNYRGAWSYKGRNSSYNGQWRIIGEEGVLIWDGDLSIQIEMLSKKGSVISQKVNIPQKYSFSPYEVFLYELKANLQLFITANDKGITPDCWCGDAINSLSMILSSVHSVESGRIISVPVL